MIFGDFLVNQSLAQEVEHLLFALGKSLGGLPGGGVLLKRLNDLARDMHDLRRFPCKSIPGSRGRAPAVRARKVPRWTARRRRSFEAIERPCARYAWSS